MSWITSLWRYEAPYAMHMHKRLIVSFLERAAAEAAKITGGRIDVLVQNAARMERENGLNGFLD